MEEPASETKNDEVVLQVQDVDSHIYSNDDTNDDTSEVCSHGLVNVVPKIYGA